MNIYEVDLFRENRKTLKYSTNNGLVAPKVIMFLKYFCNNFIGFYYYVTQLLRLFHVRVLLQDTVRPQQSRLMGNVYL